MKQDSPTITQEGFSADTSFEDVELRVGEEEGKRGFILELWSSAADLYTVGFVSPRRRTDQPYPHFTNNETRIPFLLESTVITVSYSAVEAEAEASLYPCALSVLPRGSGPFVYTIHSFLRENTTCGCRFRVLSPMKLYF